MKELISNLKFVWKYAKTKKNYMIFYLFIQIGKIIFSVIMPIFSAKIIIELTSNNYLQLLYMAIILFLLNILFDIGQYIGHASAVIINNATVNELGLDLGKNILKIENGCLDKKGTGLFIQRLTSDTGKISSSFESIVSMVSDVIKYLGVFAAVFIVSKWVFLYSIISLVVIYLIEQYRAKKRNEKDKAVRKANERITSFVTELVKGARDIKMLNCEKNFDKELGVRLDEATELKNGMQNKALFYRCISWLTKDTFSFGLILLLIYLIQNGYLVGATSLILYNYFNSLEYFGNSIGHLLEYVKDFNLSCKRVSDIIESDEFKKEKFGNVHLDKVKGNFEFDNVTFGYEDDKVLDGLSFKIKSHETVAFVGKSGAGKTTIFNLLCKMYDVDSGNILIDGINVNDLDKDSIRGNITIISQDPYIFNMSIKDNLKMVKKGLKEEDMINACKLACLDEYIESLPDKYDTIIGEGGVNLSGGQKQRLAIARALVQNTEIILFDEATSALDNETQASIQKAIDNMKNKYTILIIAHRLSTIINADRILFLEDGKIESVGTHEKLLKKSKGYKKLYESEIKKTGV